MLKQLRGKNAKNLMRRRQKLKQIRKMKLNEKKTEAAGNEDYETQESDIKRQKMQQQTKA